MIRREGSQGEVDLKKRKEFLEKEYLRVTQQIETLRAQLQQLLNVQQRLIGQSQLLDELIEASAEEERTKEKKEGRQE